MSSQLVLFSADRYHDPRVAADRARERSLAKLRPIGHAAPSEGAGGLVVQLRGPLDVHLGTSSAAQRAA